jgi:ABC-type glycerol-3-phosphate transport system substrate-binding protein
MLYNKLYCLQAGWGNLTGSTQLTFDQYYQLLLDLNATKGVGYAQNMTYSTSMAGFMYGIEPFYFGKGAEPFKDNVVDADEITVNSTTSRAAVQWVKDLMDSDLTPAWEEAGWATYDTLFRNGSIGVYFMGPWTWATTLTSNTSVFAANNTNFGYCHLPKTSTSKTGLAIGGQYYAIAKDTKVADAALKLAQYMGGKDAMIKNFLEGGLKPMRASVWDDTTVKADPNYAINKVHSDVVDEATTKGPKSYVWGTLMSKFSEELDAFMAGTQTLDQCMADTTTKFTEFLAETDPYDAGTIEREGGSGIPGYTAIGMFAALGIAVTLLIIKKRN